MCREHVLAISTAIGESVLITVRRHAILELQSQCHIDDGSPARRSKRLNRSADCGFRDERRGHLSDLKSVDQLSRALSHTCSPVSALRLQLSYVGQRFPLCATSFRQFSLRRADPHPDSTCSSVSYPTLIRRTCPPSGGGTQSFRKSSVMRHCNCTQWESYWVLSCVVSAPPSHQERTR